MSSFILASLIFFAVSNNNGYTGAPTKDTTCYTFVDGALVQQPDTNIKHKFIFQEFKNVERIDSSYKYSIGDTTFVYKFKKRVKRRYTGMRILSVVATVFLIAAIVFTAGQIFK